MKYESQSFDIEVKVRQDCYNRGYEQGRKNPCEEIVEYIEKLQKQVKEYQDKIEQGTLIELPCKVGDTVYFIIKSGNEFVLLEDTCIGFTIADGETHIGLENIPVAVNKYYFTREEAEKKLKELQNG